MFSDSRLSSSSSSSSGSSTLRGDLLQSTARGKAEHVLEAFVSILRNPSLYSKIADTLPMPRICLLELGTHPSSRTACQALAMLGLGLNAPLSSSRDFDLAGGWGILRNVLPRVWDRNVHDAALDLLPGRTGNRSGDDSGSPQMLSVFLFALYRGLSAVNNNAEQSEGTPSVYCAYIPSHLRAAPSKDAIIWILDDMAKLHESSSSFRHIFRSHSTSQLLIDSLNIFPPTREAAGALVLHAKISTKLTHFVSLVAMGNHISASQKQQVFSYFVVFQHL
jgi:hypothetical protein